MSICNFVHRHYESEGYQNTTNGTLTSNSVDFDQETMTNTSQIEETGVNQDDRCVTHLDEAVNDQSLSDLVCDISNTSDNPDMNTSGKMKVTLTVSVNRNMTHSNISNKIINTDNDARSTLDHPRSILQNKSTEILILENKKAEQYDSTSTDLNKNNTLCCKMSIVFAMFCIIGCFLMPIVLYYVTQLGEKEVTHLEYSYNRNSSSAKVCYTSTLYITSYKTSLFTMSCPT